MPIRARPASYTLAPGASVRHRQPLAATDHWYDLTVRKSGETGLLRQLAGHIETGRPSKERSGHRPRLTPVARLRGAMPN
ncbi:MAG: phospholipase domain-containing protein [Rhizomicrobium sp.]